VPSGTKSVNSEAVTLERSIMADLQVLPALTVAHRAVGDALEQSHAVDDGARRVMRSRAPRAFIAHLPHAKVERIELLPHRGADLLAYLTRVLARGGHARCDGVAIREIEQCTACESRDVLRFRGQPDASIQAFDRRAGERRRAAKALIDGDIDEPRRVLGTFEIPADPVERVGDARQQHVCSVTSRT